MAKTALEHIADIERAGLSDAARVMRALYEWLAQAHPEHRIDAMAEQALAQRHEEPCPNRFGI